MTKYLFIIIAYLIGSIPFSYILGKSIKKDDIRKRGSGNLGTSNAFRVFGALIGFSVLILDSFKSGIFILLIDYTTIFETLDMFPSYIYSAVAVIGHIFPIWMKFKGGKGVASAFGLIIFYYWPIAVGLLPVFIIIVMISKFASLGSTIVTVLAFIISLILFFTGAVPKIDLLFVITVGILMLIILYKHRSNFQRIINGNENKISFKKKK